MSRHNPNADERPPPFAGLPVAPPVTTPTRAGPVRPVAGLIHTPRYALIRATIYIGFLLSFDTVVGSAWLLSTALPDPSRVPTDTTTIFLAAASAAGGVLHGVVLLTAAIVTLNSGRAHRVARIVAVAATLRVVLVVVVTAAVLPAVAIESSTLDFAVAAVVAAVAGLLLSVLVRRRIRAVADSPPTARDGRSDPGGGAHTVARRKLRKSAAASALMTCVFAVLAATAWMQVAALTPGRPDSVRLLATLSAGTTTICAVTVAATTVGMLITLRTPAGQRWITAGLTIAGLHLAAALAICGWLWQTDDTTTGMIPVSFALTALAIAVCDRVDANRLRACTNPGAGTGPTR